MRLAAAILCAAAACGGNGDSPSDGGSDAQCKPPVGFTFSAIGERSFASFGWTGQVHNVTVTDGTPFGVTVKSCDGCDGVCSFEGPTDPVSPVNRHRCLNRTSRMCTADADCPNDGTPYRKCVYMYDAPAGAPLVGAAGPGACAWSYIPIAADGEAPTVAGTLDQSSGELNLTQFNVFLPLNGPSGMYRGACAECVGDPIANDGIKGGVCMPTARGAASDPSPDLGQPCDVHRFGNIPGFEGNYSMDCSPTVRATDGSPTAFGGLLTSSGYQLEITSASPTCTDPKFAGEKCFCGVCPDNLTACASNADCGGQTCGYLPPGCDPNPRPFLDTGTLNPNYNPSFAPGQCRGMGTTSAVTTSGNACRNNTCNWDPDKGLGSCVSTISGQTVGCYPSGVGAKLVAPGRSTRVGNVYIVDTASARCNRLTPSPALNGTIGLPGITFQKRSFRIIPTEAP